MVKTACLCDWPFRDLYFGPSLVATGTCEWTSRSSVRPVPGGRVENVWSLPKRESHVGFGCGQNPLWLAEQISQGDPPAADAESLKQLRDSAITRSWARVGERFCEERMGNGRVYGKCRLPGRCITGMRRNPGAIHLFIE
jgi:hypothetical protein